MHVVQRQVVKDADSGNEIAQAWLGHINRKIVKRPVMTLPYGAGQFGMRDQVLEEIRKYDETSPEPMFSEVDSNEAAGYLSKIIYKSIGEVVIAARSAMNWLQDTARKG